MQILEEVATKHMRCMLAEWRKVPLQLHLEAGEPILSLRLNTDRMGGRGVAVKKRPREVLLRGRKGSRLTFLRLDKDLIRGNTNEVGDVCRSFGESCLFFLTVNIGSLTPSFVACRLAQTNVTPVESNCLATRVEGWKNRVLFAWSGTLRTALEKPTEIPFSLLSGRTRIRNRSPRCVASDLWKNVSQGSRQNGCVTSGKALAL